MNQRESAIMTSDPSICCLCITHQRPRLLRRAIYCFDQQTYQNRTLLIVTEPGDQETLEVTAQYVHRKDIRLHLVDAAQRPSLGEVRNIAVKLADAQYIAQWDDDDFYHPQRLSAQMQAIKTSSKSACVLRRLLVLKHGRTVVSAHRAWEGSILCETSQLPSYAPVARGEDTVVVDRLQAQKKLNMLDRPDLYLYVFHGDNTWHEEHFNHLIYQSTAFADPRHYEILQQFFDYEDRDTRHRKRERELQNPYVAAFEEAKKSQSPYPAERFQGRGIVIVAGGEKYTTCAWVCLSQLMMLGCRLPVEIWCLGPDEMDDVTRTLFEEFENVRCRDASLITGRDPTSPLSGWECKPYAILHSAFQEVLFLDADNLLVLDPTFLFDAVDYRKEGAVFWPDVLITEPHRPIWSLLGVPYRIEPEFESGQMLIDKEKCWKALTLACHLCEFGEEFWWAKSGGGVYGDKDLFRFAWHSVGQSFAMPSRAVYPLECYGVLCQHDFAGRRLFQHRSWRKWKMFGDNPHIEDFWYEPECLQAIEVFRSKLFYRRQRLQPLAAVKLAERIARHPLFQYILLGTQERTIELLEGGRIGMGAQPREQWWLVVERDGVLFLEIGGRDGILCELPRTGDLQFEGRWLLHEKLSVLIHPVHLESSSNPSLALHTGGCVQ